MQSAQQNDILVRGHIHVARVAYKAGDYHAAYRNLNSAINEMSGTNFASRDPLSYHELKHLLGKVQAVLKLYAEAEKSFTEAIEIAGSSEFIAESECISDMRHLADCIRLRGRTAEAESLYWQCIEKLKIKDNKTESQLAKALLGLSQVYIDSHRFAEAEKTLAEALSQFENNSGVRGFWAGRTLLTMARLMWAQGRTADSRETLQLAIDILEPHIGPHHPLRLLALRRMTDVINCDGHNNGAESFFAELREAEKYLRDHDN